MGLEPQNSFKGGPRGPLYGKLFIRHHRLRDYLSPNQTCQVFWDFGPKSWLTSRHVCGHVTRATSHLRVPCCGPWPFYDFRHWNFLNCSKNIGVMAILVEGYNSKKSLKKESSQRDWFSNIHDLHRPGPSVSASFTLSVWRGHLPPCPGETWPSQCCQ